MQDLTPWQVRGGVKRVAEHFGISEAAVSFWRKRGIPEKRQAETREVIAAMLAEAPAPAQQPQDAA